MRDVYEEGWMDDEMFPPCTLTFTDAAYMANNKHYRSVEFDCDIGEGYEDQVEIVEIQVILGVFWLSIICKFKTPTYLKMWNLIQKVLLVLAL